MNDKKQTEVSGFEKVNLKGYSGIACRVKIPSGGCVIIMAANLEDLSDSFNKITKVKIKPEHTGKIIVISAEELPNA